MDKIQPILDAVAKLYELRYDCGSGKGGRKQIALQALYAAWQEHTQQGVVSTSSLRVSAKCGKE